MAKIRSFQDDGQIGEKLDSIPKNERSTIIRMALREYFQIVKKSKKAKRSEADGCTTR